MISISFLYASYLFSKLSTVQLCHVLNNFKHLNERVKKHVPSPALLTLAALGRGVPECEAWGPLPLPLQGSVGICSVWATMVEAILSPRAHMASLGGPEGWGKREEAELSQPQVPHSRVLCTVKEQH